MGLTFTLYKTDDFNDTYNTSNPVMEIGATHNLIPMWEAAGVVETLSIKNNGKRAGMLIEGFRKGIENMKQAPDTFEALTPSNGWGDVEWALGFLEDGLKFCEMRPDSFVYICK